MTADGAECTVKPRRWTLARNSDAGGGALRPRVLCVDDDRDIGATVQAILGDEGYDVTCLFEITDGALRQVIGDLKPDCVLLDSTSRTDYGDSWGIASWIHKLARSIPVVMFSAHQADSREAIAHLTERAQEAGFAAVVLKPFSIDQLVDAVSIAVARPRPLDPVGVQAQPVTMPDAAMSPTGR